MSADSSTSAESESEPAATDPLPVGRLGRLLALVAFVTAVFLFVSSRALDDDLFAIAVVVIGAVAVVTAISGFLISVASYVGDD